MPHPTWQTIALLVVAVGFFAMILARTWPRFDRKRNVPLGAALKAARAKIDAAKTDSAKADALCEAADACALAFGRSEAAASYYLRAMRLMPASAELVERAIQGLEHRPRALESLLWRKLGADPEHAPSADAIRAALKGLEKIYATRPRHAVRARAVAAILAHLK